jgi:DNA-binding NtrC family response regulator
VELFANRFAIVDRHGAIDLASGRDVVLIATSAGGASDERRWTIRCDTLQKLRHRSIAPLIDYGPIGENRRFEAWDCGAAWNGAPDAIHAIASRATTFLNACGLSASPAEPASLRSSANGPVVLPDALAGYPTPSVRTNAATIADCGLELVPRGAVCAVAELFDPAASPRARAVVVCGPRGSGLRTAVADLARAARVQGMVPIACELLGGHFAPLVAGRTLFAIDWSATAGWASLLDPIIRAPRPHVLLVAGDREIDAMDAVSLEPIAIAALVKAIRPLDLSDAIRSRVERAAARACGLPGIFADSLWGGAPAIAAATRRPRAGTRAAEVPAVYGRDPDDPPPPSADVRTWPAPGELAGLRRRAQLGAELVERGRHAPGERVLRQAAGGLARRSDWTHAAQAALALASSIARRGRSKDAHAALDDAREHAKHAASALVSIDVAIRSGHVSIDQARLDDAEATLSVAVASARAAADDDRMALAAAGLARCLFWRGRFVDADLAIGAIDSRALSAATAIRLRIAASRNAVGTRNVARAVSLSAEVVQQAVGLGDSGLVARAACAAAFAHLAVNDFEALERDAILAIHAARRARDPLRAFRARVLLAEGVRRSGRRAAAAALVSRLQKLGGTTLPAVVKARRDLLADLVLDAATEERTITRHVASSGLPALALFGPTRPSGADAIIEDAVAILHACQNADDEPKMLGDVCRRVRGQLDAASVAIAACAGAQLSTIACDGARVDLATAERAVAACAAVAPHRVGDRIEAAFPVRYGGESIGAIVVRWTLGASHSVSRALPLITMAAAAVAPAVAVVRAALLRPPPPALTELVGTGPAGAELRRAVERAGAAPFSVLIEGESGSGKELVARAVHKVSARRERPMCTLNCAALPDDLVEAELFGHARGAFTGAVGERAGVFEEAHGGTLLLDEIGELSPRAQAKVLRVIQEGELRRVGENTTRRVDVRIVAATNRDLRQEVVAGRFRLDLLYRLDVLRIVVAPLRDRREDIPLLVERFWRESTARIGSNATLSTAAMAALGRYDWPGNVRELQNVLAALAVRSPRRGIVQPTSLPPQFGHATMVDGWRIDEARRTFEERFVRAALVRTGGRRGQTAAELGLTRQGLTKLMARLGID